MRNRLILVAAAVPEMRVADVGYNTGQIIKLIEENRECGVVLFPELCVTGYTCADLFGSELLLERAEEALFAVAEATGSCRNLTAVIGLPVRFENNLYNCAAIISGGRVCGLVPKQYIPSYSEFYEGRWFSSGRGVAGRTVTLHGQTIPFGVDILAEDRESGAVLGAEICEDLWVPDKPSTHLCLAGANIIVNLSASDELIGKQEYRRQLVAQQSGSCYCAYAYASSGTGESSTDLVFSGHTLIAQGGAVLSEDIFPSGSSVTRGAAELTKILHDRRRQNTFDTLYASYTLNHTLNHTPDYTSNAPDTLSGGSSIKRARDGFGGPDRFGGFSGTDRFSGIDGISGFNWFSGFNGFSGTGGRVYRRVSAGIQAFQGRGDSGEEAGDLSGGVSVSVSGGAPVNVSSDAFAKGYGGAPAGERGNASVYEMADILKRLKVEVSRNPFVPEDDAKRGERCRKILRIQANGLATRVRAAGIYNLVIGISGGLDSTLALLVCAEAKKIVPQIRILAYTMPNEGNTSGLTYGNAKRLMELIADETFEVPISGGVRAHLRDIGHGPDYQGEGDTTYENAQARMRTYILMDAANMRNALVVGTGDLSELALGWCTYNGDHMSMYAVNASVPKTLVRYICHTYGETCGNTELRDVIFSVCNTPITPELTPGKDGRITQMTEEKTGKYDLNDFFLYYTLRYGFEPSRSAAYAMRAYPELEGQEVIAAAKRFFTRFFTHQFKRSCLPDGPKVGSVSLSPRGDWRMPSDASVKLWLADLD